MKISKVEHEFEEPRTGVALPKELFVCIIADSDECLWSGVSDNDPSGAEGDALDWFYKFNEGNATPPTLSPSTAVMLKVVL